MKAEGERNIGVRQDLARDGELESNRQPLGALDDAQTTEHTGQGVFKGWYFSH